MSIDPKVLKLLTYALDQDEPTSTSSMPIWQLGKNYFFRNAPYFYTGRLVMVTENELVITDAAWIAETGRFADALKSGEFSEVEPYPDGVEVVLGRHSLLDAMIWSHPLPREQI